MTTLKEVNNYTIHVAFYNIPTMLVKLGRESIRALTPSTSILKITSCTSLVDNKSPENHFYINTENHLQDVWDPKAVM